VLDAVAGALAWTGVGATQWEPYRAFERRGGEAESLLYAGGMAVLLVGVLQSPLLLAVSL
jgi:hypothetical protein